MSINWLLDVKPSPGLLVVPAGVESLDEAHAAIELWEHYSGKTLDAAQRLSVELMMAVGAGKKWAAATTGREMPRQNGKGVEIEVVELWGLTQRAEAILHTVHDAVLLASQAQQRMLQVLERPDLRKKIKRKWLGTGQQMIELRNGGAIWYRTRTGGGGRGVDDIDRLVVDEAQHATEEQLAAISPTMLANANAQLNAMGTSALAGKSEWWWGIRKRALSATPGSFAYLGHTAEKVRLLPDGRVEQDPIDPTDRRLWKIANPAANADRSDVMEFLEEQFQRLTPESFAQEHLGVWEPPSSQLADPKLPRDEWLASARLTKAQAKAVDGPIVLSFDVDLDGRSASVAYAAGVVSAPYVEVLDHEKDVGWLAERVVARFLELSEKRSKPIAIAYNNAGPAEGAVGAVTVALRDAGISLDLLSPVTAGGYRAACGELLAAVTERRLLRCREIRQGPLDLAASDATERPLAEGWVWHRRQATVPISPLVAATVAAHLLPVEAKPALEFKVF